MVPPKRDSSRRTIALAALMTTKLRERGIYQWRERIAPGPEWVDTGRVFTTLKGGPIAGDLVRQRFRSLTSESPTTPTRPAPTAT